MERKKVFGIIGIITIIVIISFNFIIYISNSTIAFNKLHYSKIIKEDQLPLEIYLLPTSHNDGGWLHTFNQYYERKTSVILDGVINELNNDINKKFNWVEIGYFSKWYNLQTEFKQNIVKRLVQYKQFEFITGGFVQNDEATANVDDIINQMTQGHMWLKETFNYTVEYAYQIDPFGYSSSTPTIYSKMGIKGLVLNRVSNDVKEYMKLNKQMEFVWKSNTESTDELLVSILDIHYSYPKMLDPNTELDLNNRVDEFIGYLKQLSNTRESNIILIPLGDDFTYTQAGYEFSKSMEWLTVIQENKQKFNIKEIKYSTLSEYFNALENSLISNGDNGKNELATTPLFNKDFFPYSTGGDEYWTGYYSTRPVLKKFIRDTSYLNRASEILYTLALVESEQSNNINGVNKLTNLSSSLNEVRNELSKSQHHDIITGTSRSYVLNDFINILKESRLQTYNILSNSIELILNNNNSTTTTQEPIESFNFENQLDLSILNDRISFYSIVFQNSLGWEMNQHVSIRIRCKSSEIGKIELVESSNNQTQTIQIIPVGYQESKENNNEYLVIVVINVPALGLNTYSLFLNNSKLSTENLSKSTIIDKNKEIPIFKSKKYQVEFNSNGLIKMITNLENKQLKYVDQSFQQYKSINSGPYIFNSGKKDYNYLNKPDKIINYDGPLVSQLSLFYGTNKDNSNVTSMVLQRIYKNTLSNNKTLSTENYIETGYSINGDMNRETTINYKINQFNNNNIFYTDNGIECRKRVYDDNKPISQNYYPALNYIKLLDESSKQQFTLYFDRSSGVSSPSSGEMEIMIHRTINHDDGKGIGWPSKDTSRSDGKIYLNFNINQQSEIEKKTSLQINHSPIMFVKKVPLFNQSYLDYNSNYKSTYSPIYNLPSNIHLQSLTTFSNQKIGLRLFNFYGNPNIKCESFSNQTIFKELKLNEISETGLSFNSLISPNDKLKLKSKLIDFDKFPIKCGESQYSFNLNQPSSIILQNKIETIVSKTNNNQISIEPLEIKSFLIKFNSNQFKQSKTIQVGEIQQQKDSLQDKPIEDNRYAYDFSIYPILESYYNDEGDQPSSNLALILSLSIGVPVVVTIIIVSIVLIVRKRKRNNRNRNRNLTRTSSSMSLSRQDQNASVNLNEFNE